MSVTVVSHIHEVENAVQRALEKAAMAAGGAIEGHAKELCPVATGTLRNSITHALGGEQVEGGQAPADSDGEVTVYIGTNVYYAPYVELGHNQQPGRYVPKLGKRLVADHVAAKPFLRPAVEGNLDEVKQIIERELR